jgi:hypothetical protein
MSTSKNLKLTRVVKILLDVIFGLLVFVCAILVLWIALSPFIMNVSDIAITSSVPVAIGSGDEPRFDVKVAGAESKGIRAAFVDEAQGILRLETTDWSFIFVSNLAKLLTAIGFAYVIYLLRSVLQAILQGDPFAPENTVRVRRIGYLVLAVALLQATVDYFAAEMILAQLVIVEPALSLPSPFEGEVILVSLLILVLAQVWSYGMELERDKALTI